MTKELFRIEFTLGLAKLLDDLKGSTQRVSTEVVSNVLAFFLSKRTSAFCFLLQSTVKEFKEHIASEVVSKVGDLPACDNLPVIVDFSVRQYSQILTKDEILECKLLWA